MDRDADLFGKVILWFFVFFASCTLFAFCDGTRTKNRLYPIVKEKWGAWENYRIKNCVLVEKSYGLTSKEGKTTFHDNALTYQCGTMRYTITESTINWANKCIGEEQECYFEENLKYIPEVSVPSTEKVIHK